MVISATHVSVLQNIKNKMVQPGLIPFPAIINTSALDSLVYSVSPVSIIFAIVLMVFSIWSWQQRGRLHRLTR